MLVAGHALELDGPRHALERQLEQQGLVRVRVMVKVRVRARVRARVRVRVRVRGWPARPGSVLRWSSCSSQRSR